MMNEKDLIKNVLSQNSVDKEMIQQRVINTHRVERSVRMKPKKFVAVVCACCLLLGIGVTAYALEIREYNVAVAYLKDLGIGIDGYSRKEIKLVYHDINSGEFVKELTVTMLEETARNSGIGTPGKNAKELLNDINTSEQGAKIVKITSEQVKQVTADMKYDDIVALLGETVDIGSGIYILQYEVDGEYTLDISFISHDTPCGYSGDELLSRLQSNQSIQVAQITSEQVKQVTADMKYDDIIGLLGNTVDIGSGIYILQYEVDGKYTLDISFISHDTPCGYSGDELLDMMQPIA